MLLKLLLFHYFFFIFTFSIVFANPPRYPDHVSRYQENTRFNDPLKSTYDKQSCQRPLESVYPNQRCLGTQQDTCQYFYSNSICDYTDGICKCRCGYYWDYTIKQCLLDQDYEGCWFCSKRNVTLPMMIAILVIVIVIAVFTIPTCVAVTCFRSKT